MKSFLAKVIKHTSLLFSALLILASVSCATFSGAENERESKTEVSRNFSDPPVKSARQLYKFFLSVNPQIKHSYLKKMCRLYIEEGEAEGINSDCAFVQMCLETGFLRFGNLVTPEMHNYCGLGSIGPGQPGESFATEQLGVRAHIQHLHAYATTADNVLKNECIDRRYKYVNPRGKAPTVFELAGTWAADKSYGTKLDSLLSKLEAF